MKLPILTFCLALIAPPSLEALTNRPAALMDHPSSVPAKTGGPISGTPSRDPEKVWREIKALVQAELDSGSASSIEPSFTVVTVGSTPQLTIKKGDVGDLGFGNDPYKTPFKEQMLIELLRRSLAKARLDDVVKSAEPKKIIDPISGVPDGNQQWQCYLDQAEQLVRQSVVAIETLSNKEELNLVLLKTEDQIDDLLYNKLFDSIEAYAKLNSFNVILDRGGDAPKPFSVAISTTPNGARIFVLKGLRYQQLLRLGSAAPAQWPWEELVQNPALLIGKYRYKVRWPDGHFTEGDVDVKNPSPIKLQP